MLIVLKRVSYVKNPKPVLATPLNLLKIKDNTSFGQTLKKIKKLKNIDFVLIDRPKVKQMFAALILKISGKKFFWVQNFSNPPIPGIFAKMLISQADRIIVRDKKDFYKLKSFGINPGKIRYVRN